MKGNSIYEALAPAISGVFLLSPEKSDANRCRLGLDVIPALKTTVKGAFLKGSFE